MITNRTILEIVLITWILIVALYAVHTAGGSRVHDFLGHLEYTKIIATQHRLPAPYEGWETYHPPLYYIINSLVAPKSLQSNVGSHVNYVKLLSSIFGIFVLIIIAFFLKEFIQNPFIRLLVLVFIATTPKFVMMFWSYNNDSLAVLFCFLLIFLSYKLSKNYSWQVFVLLTLVATAGLYTKYTVIFCASSIAVLAIFSLIMDLIKKRPLVKGNIFICLALVLSLLFLAPYLTLHNYHLTGKLFPSNFENQTIKVLNLTELKRGSNIILAPFLRFGDLKREWTVPWVYGDFEKRFDYWSFIFVTSVIGEYKFLVPALNIVFILLLLHLVAYVIAIKEIFRSQVTKLAGWVILLSQLCMFSFVFYCPSGGPVMDYRYISWVWIPLAVLYGSVLSNKNSFASKLLSWVMLASIVVGIYFLLVCEC